MLLLWFVGCQNSTALNSLHCFIRSKVEVYDVGSNSVLVEKILNVAKPPEQLVVADDDTLLLCRQ